MFGLGHVKVTKKIVFTYLYNWRFIEIFSIFVFIKYLNTYVSNNSYQYLPSRRIRIYLRIYIDIYIIRIYVNAYILLIYL